MTHAAGEALVAPQVGAPPVPDPPSSGRRHRRRTGSRHDRRLRDVGRGVSGVWDLLAVTALLCCGIVAGVFVAVALSVVPALAAMPATRYLEAHRLLGRGYHPAMPVIVTAAVLLEGGLVVTGGPGRAVHAASLLLLIGVQLVSHLRMEPVNERIRAVAPGPVPPGWDDPRRRWSAWHRVRTVLAVAAFTLGAIASVLVR
jgi:uncharacterized membrane protein